MNVILSDRTLIFFLQTKCSRCSIHGQFESVAEYRVHISLWHDMSFQGNPQNRLISISIKQVDLNLVKIS